MNEFTFANFETAEFLVESLEAPKIKAGGSSSSNILNRYFEATTRDLGILATRTNTLASKVERVSNVASQQAAALLATINSISTRVDAASGYTSVLADMHSSFYVHGTTTATVHEVFGQATLPIRGQTDLLITTDVYGNKYVIPEIEVSVAKNSASAPTSISFSDYEIDLEGTEMLKGIQTWLVSAPGASGNVFFKLKTPLQFRGLQPNVLELWPLPAFGCDLLGVWYQKIDDPSPGTWYTLDLTYAPGFTGSTVPRYGPIRLFIPENTIVSQFVIGVKPNSASWLGFKQIKLLNLEFETSATLVVEDPYSRTINSLVLKGKDPGDLSQLSITTAGNLGTINLSTSNSAKTPVITAAILAV